MISLKKRNDTVIEDYSVRPILNEEGEPISDIELWNLTKDMLDECASKNVAPPSGLTPNFCNFIYAACEDAERGMTAQQIKDKYIQRDVNFNDLAVNPNLKENK